MHSIHIIRCFWLVIIFEKEGGKLFYIDFRAGSNFFRIDLGGQTFFIAEKMSAPPRYLNYDLSQVCLSVL